MLNRFTKDEKGFTGLEAAIVLVAFVVVAAVFSYVMLGAGFYTTQKAQEVVHTGVAQASSSIELNGDVIANNYTESTTKLGNVTVFLQLTSGGSSVDMNKTLIVFTARDHAPIDLKLGKINGNGSCNDHYNITSKYCGDTNDILDKFEKFEITIPVGDYNLTANNDFQFEIKPPEGASYTIHRQVPASITSRMTLY